MRGGERHQLHMSEAAPGIGSGRAKADIADMAPPNLPVLLQIPLRPSLSKARYHSARDPLMDIP